MKIPYRVAAVAAAVSLAAVMATVTGASAASSTSNWKLGYYNTSGRALSMSSVSTTPPVATFNFTNQPNTALLISTQGSNKTALLGNDSGKTITATFTISGATSAFTYYGEPDSSGSTTAYVRLFFETSGGGFAYTNYWWSDTAFQGLGNGTFTLTAQVDPTLAAWSDWNGKPSSSNVEAFTAAASHVTGIGFSFGGGNGFENGVGTTDGSGSFTLNSFTVS